MSDMIGERFGKPSSLPPTCSNGELWWHGVIHLANRLHEAMDNSHQAVAMEAQLEKTAQEALAALENRDDALPEARAGARRKVREAAARRQEVEREAAALTVMVDALAGFVANREPWEPLTAEEPDETLHLVLTNAVNAVLGQDQATATIPANDTPPPPPPTSEGSFRVTDDWGSGFVAEVIVPNDQPVALSDWTLEFDFPYAIHSLWNVQLLRHEGNHYVVTHSGWNRTLAAGEAIAFGFSGSPGGVTTGPSPPPDVSGTETSGTETSGAVISVVPKRSPPPSSSRA